MVEHTAVNRGVVGSSPTRGALASVLKFNMATWPSGKARVCNTLITSSNLVVALNEKTAYSNVCSLFVYLEDFGFELKWHLVVISKSKIYVKSSFSGKIPLYIEKFCCILYLYCKMEVILM